jgi:Fic family protein
MVSVGRRDLGDIGHYRTSKEPMHIVSGRIGASKVDFEAPPSERVSSEMNRFIAWFNQTAPDDGELLPAITRAGIAYIYFEAVHPFEDGNGRIGRAIAEKAATLAVGQSVLLALSTAILAHQERYYEALEEANRQIDITEWLIWFAGIALEAQRRTIARVNSLHLLPQRASWDALRNIDPRIEDLSGLLPSGCAHYKAAAVAMGWPESGMVVKTTRITIETESLLV